MTGTVILMMAIITAIHAFKLKSDLLALPLCPRDYYPNDPYYNVQTLGPNDNQFVYLFVIHFWVNYNYTSLLDSPKEIYPTFKLIVIMNGELRFQIRCNGREMVDILVSKKRLDNGQWHWVTFSSSADKSIFTVDGEFTETSLSWFYCKTQPDMKPEYNEKIYANYISYLEQASYVDSGCKDYMHVVRPNEN